MQRFLLSLLVILGSSSLFAQTIEEIEAQVGKGELDKAKATVDAFLAKEKNQTKSDGWWYKGLVYNEIAKSEKYKSLAPDGRMEAFNAFKKYYEIDPKAVRGTLEQHVRLFDIYNGYFEMGVTNFGGTKFDDALTNFKNALMVEEFISGKGYEYNGFKFPVFDTTLIQNIALSAYKANKLDEAVIYNKKIADRRISGESFLDVYLLIVEYYHNKKDLANREKYLNLGNELYPENNYWFQTEVEDVDENDKKALFAQYEKLLPKYPGNYTMRYNYGVELYNYSLAKEKSERPADYKTVVPKIETVLKQAIAINKNNPESKVLLARSYYNLLYDLDDQRSAIKGTTPADQKRKDSIKLKATVMADQVIQQAQDAYDLYDKRPCLKGSEKANFRSVADFLSAAYEYKGDKVKTEVYEKRKPTIDQVPTLVSSDAKKIKDGMTKAEVKAILCDLATSMTPTTAYGSTELWSYDSYKLNIYFDKDGKVSNITSIRQ